MISRRAFMGMATAVMVPSSARGQQPGRLPRLGILAVVTSPFYEVFREALQEHGWIEGKNLLIEFRVADGRSDRLASLAVALVNRPVDVIFASNTQAAVAARNVTTSIPIVVATVGNPIGDGLVESVARPGRNVTGLTSLGAELGAKQLDLLKETLPHVSRVAVLFNPDSPAAFLAIDQARSASETLRLGFHVESVRTAAELEVAFHNIRGRGCDAILVPADPLLFRHRVEVARLAAKHRLPAMYGVRGHVEAGGLMAYAVSFTALYRRAAFYVDRILRGANPAELPIEQPSEFELTINAKTARALGLTIPQSLLLRADEVIQ